MHKCGGFVTIAAYISYNHILLLCIVVIKSRIPCFSIYTNLPIQITSVLIINLKCFVWVMQEHVQNTQITLDINLHTYSISLPEGLKPNPIMDFPHLEWKEDLHIPSHLIFYMQN